jgi:hypothetical protein
VNPISSQINQTLFPGYKVYGGMGFAGVNGNPNSPYNTDWHMFQPRLGAAFQLNSKTALRGGWGLSFVSNVSTGAQNGFSQSTPYVATNNGGETPAGVISNPFPSGLIAPMRASLGMLTGVGQGFTYADPRRSDPQLERLRHLKAIDSEQRTVILVQVETQPHQDFDVFPMLSLQSGGFGHFLRSDFGTGFLSGSHSFQFRTQALSG